MEERRAVERIKGGDVGGLEPLVRAHYARCVRAAYLILRDREAAEDVVQGAFARVPEAIKSFDEARSFGPWFSKTVVNDAVKAASRRERTVSFYQGDAEELVSRMADPSRGPQEAAEDSETRRRVWGALEQLPPAQRSVIVQRYYLGMTEAEMAVEVSSPPGTIKSRLNTARKNLSKLLRPQVRAVAPLHGRTGGEDRD
jgi:RNA polymerase sigma-70 factor, ECF subfamily